MDNVPAIAESISRPIYDCKALYRLQSDHLLEEACNSGSSLHLYTLLSYAPVVYKVLAGSLQTYTTEDYLCFRWHPESEGRQDDCVTTESPQRGVWLEIFLFVLSVYSVVITWTVTKKGTYKCTREFT